MNKKHQWLLIIILFLTIASIFHFSSPNLADNDSFFYIRRAWQLRTQSFFDMSFPWTYHSAIRIYSSALWFGFAVFLIPFTLFNNLFLGLKLAGILLTAFALLAYYIVIKRHQLKLALLWPFLLLFSAPNVLYRFLMVRSQLISVGLSVLLFSLLISGSVWLVFFASAGIVWFHMNFAWLPVLILGVVVGTRFFIEKTIDWKKIGAVMGGMLAGWLLRPEAINAVKLFYIQIFQSMFEKSGGAPLLFGQEHFPLQFITLLRNFSLVTILWTLTIIVFVFVIRRRQQLPQKALIWSSFALSVLFFLLTMLVSRRAYDLWLPFNLLFVASIFTYAIPAFSFRWKQTLNQAGITLIATILVITSFYSIYKTAASLMNSAYPPERHKEAALWLKDNSNPGDIVFNVSWSRFSELFFWNQQNYYVGGLDPIFQYAYNPSLYWKYHYLATGLLTDRTCGADACTEEMLEDTYEVLKRDFDAKYVFLSKELKPELNQYLESDSRFKKTFDNGSETIFFLK